MLPSGKSKSLLRTKLGLPSSSGFNSEGIGQMCTLTRFTGRCRAFGRLFCGRNFGELIRGLSHSYGLLSEGAHMSRPSLILAGSSPTVVSVACAVRTVTLVYVLRPANGYLQWREFVSWLNATCVGGLRPPMLLTTWV